jgi:hypothetical protein
VVPATRVRAQDLTEVQPVAQGLRCGVGCRGRVRVHRATTSVRLSSGYRHPRPTPQDRRREVARGVLAPGSPVCAANNGSCCLDYARSKPCIRHRTKPITQGRLAHKADYSCASTAKTVLQVRCALVGVQVSNLWASGASVITARQGQRSHIRSAHGVTLMACCAGLFLRVGLDCAGP